jgi:hypothetical protein
VQVKYTKSPYGEYQLQAVTVTLAATGKADVTPPADRV